MAIYGTIRQANINIDTDVDIFYNYRPSRTETSELDSSFKRLNAIDVLTKSTLEDADITNKGIQPILNGMYDLNLSLSVFNQRGIYTIYIAPKQIYTRIVDANATLSAFPNIKGIVLRRSDISENDFIMANGGLEGFRVEYFDSQGERRQNTAIITSNNLVEPIVGNVQNSNMKSIQYRFNDSSDLVFCTVSPSTAPSIKPNAAPNIGSTDQQICLCNTSFNPVTIEIEMVDNDMESVATLIGGTQTRNLDNGLITTYNSENEIFRQMQLYTLKDNYTGAAKFEVREPMGNNIDYTQEWDNIVN
ncbi:MAG: hypothetical protein M0R03_08935 [Novosphingobium sp.]|nr:hypothetical protein [Novosphingobium sp.]